MMESPYPDAIELIQFAPIRVLGLSLRAYNVLEKNNVVTVGDLCMIDDGTLMSLRGMGSVSFSEIGIKKVLVMNIISAIQSDDPKELDVARVDGDFFDYIFNNTEDISNIEINDVLSDSSPSSVFAIMELGIKNLKELVYANRHSIVNALPDKYNSYRKIVDSVYYRLQKSQDYKRIAKLKKAGRMNIACLSLPVRAVNALLNNSIDTIDKLMLCSKEQLLSFDGLGETSLDEINEKLASFADNLTENGEIVRPKGPNFGEFLKQQFKNSDKFRNIQIVADYYNNKDETLESLGQRMDITRERVRQIAQKAAKKIGNAYMHGVIDYELTNIINKKAKQITEINLVGISDDIFTSAGILRLLNASIPNEIKVYKDPIIHGEWLVQDIDSFGGMLKALISKLENSNQPESISDLIAIFGIRKDILLSIDRIAECNGFVTLKYNKEAMGYDRVSLISNFIEELNRPASIAEIIENTDLTPNQVRGALSYQNYFVNVGKSVYALSNEDYRDKDIDELMEDIIVAENRGLRINQILDYVTRFRKTIAVAEIEKIVNEPDSRFRKSGEFILLRDWSDDKILKLGPRSYKVELEDAILEVFSEADEDTFHDAESMAEALEEKYGDDVSTNVNSIKATLLRLRDEEKIIRVGEDVSGIYAKKRSSNRIRATYVN